MKIAHPMTLATAKKLAVKRSQLQRLYTRWACKRATTSEILRCIELERELGNK